MRFVLSKGPENGQWYWKFLSDNNKSIAIGGEGYNNKQDALHAISIVRIKALSANVFDESTQSWIQVP
jgi:uncharacterized protein YegP (UPF0339 family)